MKKILKSTFFVFLASFILLQCSKEKKTFINGNDGGSYNHNRSVGASSIDLLSDNTYTSLKIEIQYMPGFEPDAAAVNHMVSQLNARLNKPGGIAVVQKQIPAASETSLSASKVSDLELQHRTVFSTGTELGVYFLFTNGNYTNANVLGIAYRNTSMCIFGKTVNDNSGAVGQPSRTKLTATVLEHEFGHILGLVDTGTPMVTNHKDAANGAHCNNNNCLMYYGAETTDILGFLITGNIPSFDANCINDLQANSGK